MKIRKRYFDSLKDVERAAIKIGCDPTGIQIMQNKALFSTIQIADISIKAAIIIKQEAMALGGEVIVPKEVMTLLPKTTTVLLAATNKQISKLCRKLYQQPFGCKEIAKELENIVSTKINTTNHQVEETWVIKDTILDFSKPLLMGIVNITPDSFSDGNLYLTKEAAIEHCKTLIAEGADILDLGAESSRPGSDSVNKAEELNRMLPVVQALVADPSITIPISIDTYKPEVADACLKAGAHMINDITGLQNPQMQDIVAKHQCPIIMMHMQGSPKTMQANPQYNDVVDDIMSFFQNQIKICEQKGIKQIILDPGIGFGKTVEHNLQILKRLKELHILKKPILIGTSRKSFINKTIGGESQDRLEGTIATNVIAAMHNCAIFRVHDVKQCKRAIDLTRMIQNIK
jgi:dihydropteroate synthase